MYLRPGATTEVQAAARFLIAPMIAVSMAPPAVTAMWVQNSDAGGYWENQGYNWFSGL
jgi:hypothetical protein